MVPVELGDVLALPRHAVFAQFFRQGRLPLPGGVPFAFPSPIFV
jgi:hypothetical protein